MFVFVCLYICMYLHLHLYSYFFLSCQNEIQTGHLKLTYPKPKSAPNLLPSFTLWRIHICICGSICIYISPYHDMTLWDCCNISNISQVSSAAMVLIVCVSRSCKAGSQVPFKLKIVQQIAADGFGAKKIDPFFTSDHFSLWWSIHSLL